MLNALLFEDHPVLRERLAKLWQLPQLGLCSQTWHPRSGYGGAGDWVDMRASMKYLHLLARMWLAEEQEALHLLPLFDSMVPDADVHFSAEHLACRFGHLSLQLRVDHRKGFELDIDAHYFHTPKELLMRFPKAARLVELDGKSVNVDGRLLKMGPRTKKVRVVLEA